MKEQLTNIIYQDFYKDYHYNSAIPTKILNKLIPDQVNERENKTKIEEPKQKIKIIKLNGK